MAREKAQLLYGGCVHFTVNWLFWNLFGSYIAPRPLSSWKKPGNFTFDNMGALSSGVIQACLNAEGKTPVWRDVLMMWVSAGIAWRRWDGIGSSGQVAWLERMSLETSASESGEKYVNKCMFAGKMCLTDCGVENCALMVLIVLMKHMAKSSAAKVDEGREEEDKGGRKMF